MALANARDYEEYITKEFKGVIQIVEGKRNGVDRLTKRVAAAKERLHPSHQVHGWINGKRSWRN